MGDIIELKPNMNMPEALRNIAESIEDGKINPESITLIAHPDIYQLGVLNDNNAVCETIFNCNFAIHKLMSAAMGINEE